MKNLSFMALWFEKWKQHVGFNYSAAAPRNFNIPDTLAHQLDASLTQSPSSRVTPDLPHRKQKIEPGLLSTRGREEEHCWAGSLGGMMLSGVQRGAVPGGGGFTCGVWWEPLPLNPLLRGKLLPANKAQGTALA